jgi:hypothetical protein
MIYKIYEWGYIKIKNNNYVKLLQIRNNVELIYTLGGIEIEGDIYEGAIESGGCVNFKNKSGDHSPSNSNFKLHWKVGIQTYPWSCYAISKSVNYIKENNKWKKFRTQTYVKVWGQCSDYNPNTGKLDCTKSKVFNSENSNIYALDYNVSKLRHRAYIDSKVKSGWVKGIHKTVFMNSSYSTYNSVLTF